MTIAYFAGCVITGVTGDTKPNFSALTNWRFVETDTGNIYVHNGSTWVLVVGASKSESFSNKFINIDSNTIKHSTTNAAGDILKGDGTSFVRLPRGSANQVLTVNAGGTDITWAAGGAGGGGAGFAAAGTSTQNGDGSTTVFNIAHGIGLDPDAVTVSPTSLDANSSTYQLDKDATNITITYNTAPPSGSSNLSWLWGAAFVNQAVVFTPTSTTTLTNKTINVDANTVKHSTTNAAGDILKGDGTKFNRLARGSANQVLAVNAGGTDVAWATPASAGGDVFLGQTNTYGDFDSIFRSSRLKIRNPANTFSYIFAGSAITTADKTLTLPLLTGNDTLVTEAFGQTLTNKTIAAGSNTISGIADAQLSAHTSTKVTITAKGQLNTAIAYNDQANTYGDFDQTFRTTRLILRDSDNSHGYLFAGSNLAANRTVTLPLLPANDTFVMEAFAQNVTSKTINATDNTITDTSTAAGDLMVSNGTKFVRKARGSANTFLRTNTGGTDIEWVGLDSERVGKSTAASGASTYNIAHGLGSVPTYAFVDCSSHTTARTFTVDATNIVVTFASTIASGTVTIYWRVVA